MHCYTVGKQHSEELQNSQSLFIVLNFIRSGGLGFYVCVCIVLFKQAKCTVVEALRLCTGRTAHRGSRGIVLLILDLGEDGGEWLTAPPGSITAEKEPRYAFERDAESGLQPVWTIWGRGKYLASAGCARSLVSVKTLLPGFSVFDLNGNNFVFTVCPHF